MKFLILVRLKKYSIKEQKCNLKTGYTHTYIRTYKKDKKDKNK